MVSHRKPFALASLMLLVVASVALSQEQFLAHTVQAQVIVLDDEAARQSLLDWTEAAGGYFLYAANDRVQLRIPAPAVDSFREAVEMVADEVLGFEQNARDLREELGRVQAGIDARREVLILNLGFLDDANVVGTLALEREISGLIGEIEQLEGRRRKLEHDRAFANANVYLSSRAATLPGKRPSSFGWINTLDLYRYLEESRYGY